MKTYNKISCNGVSMFVAVNDLNQMKKLKKDFDGDIELSSNGEPREYSTKDITNIQDKIRGKLGKAVTENVNTIFGLK